MVVKIRLARWGARNNPFYGIVVANSRAPRDGKHLERVGTYNPIPDENHTKFIELDVKRIKYWISVGAQPTERVAWLLAKAGLMPPTPKQLHNIGAIDLNDQSTWNIQVTDKEGKEEFIDQFEAKNRPELLAAIDKKVPFADNRLDHTKITLNGQKPKEPLTPDEGLFVLKTYLGIH